MKRTFLTALIVLGAIAITTSVASAGLFASATNGGNSYQWMRDDDGDGIPNGIDPDWAPPADGTGYGHLGPFVGPMPTTGDGTAVRSQKRVRSGFLGGEKGDLLRIRVRSRDGSSTS